MICNTIKKALALNVSAAIMSFSVSFSASAQGQLEKDNIGYFDYMMWNQDDTEKITFKTDENSCLFSMGRSYDRMRDYKSLSIFERSMEYKAEYYPQGNSFIGIYGWTTEPLLEYYNELMEDEFICEHPGINTSTVRLLRDDMLRYVREAKHEPTFIDLPTE